MEEIKLLLITFTAELEVPTFPKMSNKTEEQHAKTGEHVRFGIVKQKPRASCRSFTFRDVAHRYAIY